MERSGTVAVESALAGAPAVRRVLIVSNRLPVTAHVEGRGLRLRPSDGGLASGLRQVAREWPVMWFGWLGLAQRHDGLSDQAAEAMHNGETGPMVGISLDESEVSHFYRRYCNSVLWPTLHGWTNDPLPEPADWDTYYSVNQRYTEAILRKLQPGDRVWVHDYHLLLVPRMLRERVPKVPVAFFLHTPFPEPEVFAHVPQSSQLLHGMLGANVVGFHTNAYARNFLAAVEAQGVRVRGNNVLDGARRACVRTRPMGIECRFVCPPRYGPACTGGGGAHPHARHGTAAGRRPARLHQGHPATPPRLRVSARSTPEAARPRVAAADRGADTRGDQRLS